MIDRFQTHVGVWRFFHANCFSSNPDEIESTTYNLIFNQSVISEFHFEFLRSMILLFESSGDVCGVKVGVNPWLTLVLC